MNIGESKVVNNTNDLEEIMKFEAIAHHWWDLEGEFKLLHRINPVRLSYIAEYSDGLFGKKILDVGCGGGILTESMAREGAIVTGIDMGFELIQVASLHALKFAVQIEYIQETVEEHVRKRPQYYDIVTCMEMLEHVLNPQSIVNACANLVKPGGHVFFSTINRSNKAWLVAIVGAEYILRMIPKGMHKMKKFIKPAELLNWIDQTSLQEKHITGLHYNLILDKFKLSPNIDVNYMLHVTAKKN